MKSTIARIIVSTLAIVSAETLAAEAYGSQQGDDANYSSSAKPAPTIPAGEPKAKAKPKPQFQYDSGDIRIPVPTADEPKVKEFNADTIRAAAKYLDAGALAWTRKQACVACHMSGAYLLARPMLTKLLGQPNEEVFAEFIESPQEFSRVLEFRGMDWKPEAL